MKEAMATPKCSGCGSSLRIGELVGLDEESGVILCCLCLDLKTCKLTEVDAMAETADSDEESHHQGHSS